MISSELNNDTPSKYDLKKIICDIIGFDVTNPQTILYDYSPQFSQIRNTADQNGTIYPEQAKKEQPQETKKEEKQFPIEEVSISKGLSVANSSGQSVDVNKLISEPLSYSINSDEPQILIVHTHTTESYTDSGKTKYTASDSDRSTDSSKNMIAVGNALAEVLNSRGIKTIHDTTVHDFPAYNGSYERCKATVLKNLEKYPSIKIVLDVHRDGIVREDGTKVKVSSEVEGNKTAQCMFVVGTNSELTHNNWQENLKLAAKIQNKANEMYPDFMRPINLRSERFNQQLSKGSIIIEVGSNGNTLNEAVYSAKLMGNVIASLFGK
jgi:stage II sporulation protein P